ncbi:hypothetical protein BT93_A1056 [Corymbia citriodora subsp. variegata]|nr:hypothetical protein BT93_A1056 [Corymbia citriodora subsp. variegata]
MAQNSHLRRRHIHVGVILDTESPVGGTAQQCMTMAISDLTVELLENEQVDALIGLQTSEETELLVELGDRVPIISFSASSPFLFTDKNPNFIRMTTNDNSQVGAIADLVQEFGWRELVIIHEDKARDIYAEAQLYKLMALFANIFIVHMSATLASRFFLKVNELGMMSTGYGWIVTDRIVNQMAVMDRSALNSMQGIIKVRPYIPPSKRLHNFSLKWRNSFFTNQHHQIPEVNVYCLWAYDSVWALATTAHPTTSREKKDSANKFAPLLPIPRDQQDPIYQENRILTQFNGITTGLNRSTVAIQSPSVRDMGSIGWPGSSMAIPKIQRIMPKAGKRMRIGVPIKVCFKELVGVELDPMTNATAVTGFCIDVFKAAIDMLPYEVKFEFIPFTNSNISMAASYYDDLIYQVYSQQYDAAVGDITITANTSLYVDFTIPFTETEVGMIVPIETSRNPNMWIFIQPLKVDLWLVIGAFFVFTGCVTWKIEHNDNDEFKGPLAQQIGIAMWYSFSTLCFLFVVLILTSSYTANLSSRLTVQWLQSLPKGESIGFPFNSPADQTFLINQPLKKHSFYPLKKFEDYANAPRDGSQNGGVSAIIDEIPYVKLFLSEYSAQYTMVDPSCYGTKGFAFAFRKGPPLVPDISSALAKMREEGQLYFLSQNWFQNHSLYTNQDSATKVTRLDIYSFRGLFLITGITSSVAAMVFYKYVKKESMTSQQHEVVDKLVEEKFSPVSDIPSRRTNSKHIRRYSF